MDTLTIIYINAEPAANGSAGLSAGYYIETGGLPAPLNMVSIGPSITDVQQLRNSMAAGQNGVLQWLNRQGYSASSANQVLERSFDVIKHVSMNGETIAVNAAENGSADDALAEAADCLGSLL
jgi:hypothetical protein